MSSYPSLNRLLAAGLTLFILGASLAWMLTGSGNPNPVAPSPVNAQGPKANTGDWIMYGGSVSRNMANLTVKGLPIDWDVETKKNIKWIADLGSKSYGGPIIANGRVFIGTNNENARDTSPELMTEDVDPKTGKPKLDPKTGKPKLDPKTGKPVLVPMDLGVVMAFDEGDGKFQWQAIFKKLGGGQVVDWPREGICSTPHIEGDKMYYVSNRCEVVCANVKDGKFHWKLDMIKELGVFPHNISDCSPLLVGDHLWVVTSNGVNEDHISVPAPKAPSFIKVDKVTGKTLWQDNSPSAALADADKANQGGKDFLKKLVNSGRLIQHGQWANPSYSVVDGQKQVIFPGGDGWIYSFDTDGKLIWKFDCNPKDAIYELARKGTRNDFIATPVIYKNRVYIGVGQDPEHESGVGHFWCIDMTKKGDVSPELVTDDSVFPPKTKKNPNSAEVWHYGGVITDAKERAKLKRNFYFGRTMSTCAIHEDILYISELSGLLHCLDANKGTVHWTFETEAPIWSSPYYADGKVYLGTDGQIVFIFEHGTKMKKLGEIEMGSRVRATPVAANGVLYVMTENKLFAIAEKK